ncbi:1-acyl-sn-glycerol-3-phosphate acyltransferase [Aliifodinibius sp. S!AR15-10]|uniref:1-acyl-sn-glycerol-3-phosphate acyltransferase n=1 Tax=Aliifodinibius sp. S!AR15-10 TaxID=2950437 RepID=UPI0028612F36|nr:1-acyl-sn-glycerol-3-phosphate acyltransferase [Aliifodinibius sp. S!AR15-10]MDR8392695.1 1-acyl-sn-glycerol-3-phosphate acyltransferase [Aliifodinibius sp. S!AR15-10]
MRRNYLWYQFFRYAVVSPALDLFHSQCTVSSTEYIPSEKPVIFVSNHQNALLDALHLVCNTRKFVHFLTRAEPFEVPVVSSFLRSLNMMPVYRVRDGMSSIKKNETTFARCYDHLGKGDAILVFAEANHDLRRRIRPLSKGFTRIAFGAEVRHNWQLDLQVIPVGINYGQHRKSRRPVHVEFGECIPIASYKELYLQDERQAAQELKQATAEAMKSLTMHVPNLNHYPLHHLLLDELESNRENLIQPGIVNERVAKIDEHVNEKLLDKTTELLEKSDGKADLNNFITKQNWKPKDLLLSPVYLFTLLNNLIPYQLIRWITEEFIQDHVFDGSAKFLCGLFLLPSWYLLITLLLGLAGVNSFLIPGYFLLSLITAPLFVDAKDLLLKDSAQQLEKENPELYQTVMSEIERFKAWREELFERN